MDLQEVDGEAWTGLIWLRKVGDFERVIKCREFLGLEKDRPSSLEEFSSFAQLLIRNKN